MDEKKVREAIEAFQGQVDWLKRIDDKVCEESRRCCIEYFETAIEALEKQLSKKVEVKEWSPARCPSCGAELSEPLGDGYYTYPTFLKRCPNVDCGQRLDW